MNRAEVTKLQEASDVHLDVLDVLVPCRKFSVTYKVAEVGKVSLTSEFLLRLVHSVEGMEEADAAAFFGFSAHEMSYIANDCVDKGFLERRDGRLWLSIAGRELFPPHSDIPEIYDVEQRSEEHIFDVIALAPVRGRSLSPFERALPEVPAMASKVAELSKLVPAAFRKHFDSVGRRGADVNLRQSLYSVDNVTSVSRLFTTAAVTVVGKRSDPGAVEPDLSGEWSPYELDDRVEIVEATARLLSSVHIKATDSDDNLFQALVRIAPNALADFVKVGLVNRSALYREAVKRAGYLRANQKTILTIGTLFTNANFARVLRALRYAKGDANQLRDAETRDEVEETYDFSSDGPDILTLSDAAAIGQPYFWHVPHLPIWGATRRLPKALDRISGLLSPQGADPVCISLSHSSSHLRRAFRHIISSHAQPLGLTRLEIFLVPKLVAAVIAHAPVGEESYMLPLGVLSFDQAVVRAATQLLQDLTFEPISVLQSDVPNDLEGAVRDALWAG